MKAICVFSGGLDSMLAAALVRDQGVEVLAFFFETPFFAHHKAEKSARSIRIPFKAVPITERHMEVVKHPRHGYGGHMNPCIDCHSLMIRIAGEMMREEGADFIITGEVLGQRPMSQNRNSLARVAKESCIGDLLLRPLSAKHLPITLPEEKGWVDRELLMDLQGRSRKPQIELAAKLGIREFPTPAGGCLLTEKAFSHRLRDLLGLRPDPEIREIELLKVGRHFRINPEAKLVVGRNKKENDMIRSLFGTNDLTLTCVAVPGPLVLGIGNFTDERIAVAAEITATYGDGAVGEEIYVRVVQNGVERIIASRSTGKEKFKPYML